MNNNVLIIFAKWLELGKCKTRIAKKTSAQFALDFSHACLSDLVSHLRDSTGFDIVFGVDNEKEAKLFNEAYGFRGVLTTDATGNYPIYQSDKFNNLFVKLLKKQYMKVVLIPMDLPFLEEKDINVAFGTLENKPYSLGPEHNGGIYLMGVRSPYSKNIFSGVRWSTPNSSADFITNCGSENTSVLSRRNDLNTLEEVMAARGGILRHCPRLFELLSRNGFYERGVLSQQLEATT